MKRIFLSVIFLLSTFAITAQTTDDVIELMKSDIKSNRKAIITETMKFTEAQSNAFWPVYREYEYELEKLADQRIANIKNYEANQDKLTDEKADELVKASFKFMDDRLSLNKKYYKKFAAVLTPAVAMKYMQVENEIQLLMDVSVVSAIPYAKKTEKVEKK